MLIKDRLYGTIEITSPVMLELINSKEMLRLKGIAQFGVPDKYYHLKNFSRFEHCVGVMLLLHKLGASEEEQIAGLLHDVSHTAFSHVVDWVVGEGNTEDFQDEGHAHYINTSSLPEILSRYGFDAKRITDYHHFGLLERDLPDICADRVDYSLREFDSTIAVQCLAGLSAKNNQIVFNNLELANLFARNYLSRQIKHWGGFEAVSRYRIFANLLRVGLKEKVINQADFWQVDSYLINKLESSDNSEINRILHILENKSLADLPKSDVIMHKKFRYVDPLFKDNGKLQRLSTKDAGFASELELAEIENKKGIRIPLV